jgi:hypothetical protein
VESNVIFPELPTYVGVPSLGGLLSLLLTLVLPVAAALFMRVQWSAFAKGLVLLGFSAVKIFVEAWLLAVNASESFNFGQVGYAVVVQFALAVVAYFGLLRNTGVQRAAIAGGVVKSRVIDGDAYR